MQLGRSAVNEEIFTTLLQVHGSSLELDTNILQSLLSLYQQSAHGCLLLEIARLLLRALRDPRGVTKGNVAESLAKGPDGFAKLCLIAEEEPSIGIGLVIEVCLWLPKSLNEQQSSLLRLLTSAEPEAKLQPHLLAAELFGDQAMRLVRLVCMPSNVAFCMQLVQHVLSELTLVQSASLGDSISCDLPKNALWPRQRETMVKLVEAFTMCLGESRLRPTLSKALECQLAAALRLLMAEPELQACGVALTSEIMHLDAEECKILQATFAAGTIDESRGNQSGMAKSSLKSFVPDQAWSNGAGNFSLGSQTCQCAPEDFTAVAKLLKPMLDSRQGTTLADIREALGLKPSGVVASEVSDGHQEGLSTFVLTATTQENIHRVRQAALAGIPLLLEGDTGIGKSATIQAAASEAKANLVRFNMSSHITVDDLFGRVALETKEGGESFHFVPQPFTFAFESGRWLLLDELNLAPDNVLQSIEAAIDTGQLHLTDSSSSTNHNRIISMHPSFRLFAAQNPAVNEFRGKRETLSSSLLDRFQPLQLLPLPNSECTEIVASQLHPGSSDGLASSYGKRMVAMHSAVAACMKAKIGSSAQPPVLATFTLRDLLKWAARCSVMFREQAQGSSSGRDLKLLEQPMAFEAWSVYGARLPSCDLRAAVAGIIQEHFMCWGGPDACDPHIKIANPPSGLHQVMVDQLSSSYKAATTSSLQQAPALGEAAEQIDLVHQSVLEAILAEDFVREHGFYGNASAWKDKWLRQVQSQRRSQSMSQTDVYNIGEALYTAAMRGEAAKQRVRMAFVAAAPGRVSKVEVEQTSDAPFILTPRVKGLWKLIVSAMKDGQPPEPVLVYGAPGCGKSAVIRQLALALGQGLQGCYLTSEVDATALVGQQMPNDEVGEGRIVWRDGAATKAYKQGCWLLIDNLDQADPCVLERMNPLLEQPPTWVLTEQGHVDPLKCCTAPDGSQMCGPAAGFAILATMNSETRPYPLSPALANRFTVYSMQDMPTDAMEFNVEVNMLAAGLMGLTPGRETQIAADFCKWLVKKEFCNSTGQLIRLLDRAYLLACQRTMDIPTSLAQAAFVIFGKREGLNDSVSMYFRQVHAIPAAKLAIPLPPATSRMPGANKSQHVLTSSRRDLAAMVLACVDCNIPVLLEGPAAVGKTSLIAFLATEYGKCSLERVNNSDMTTIQDYFGSWLPVEDKLEFKPGVLLTALENGSWLLADELNLAPAPVISMLAPLLEGQGKIAIPGTDRHVNRHENFRSELKKYSPPEHKLSEFFATQNPAKYANRQSLPSTLLSRFVQLRAGDFPKGELAQIIVSRSDEALKADIPCEVAQQMEQLYFHLQGIDGIDFSMRDIIKWLRRHRQLGRSSVWWVSGLFLLSSRIQAQSQASLRLIDSFTSINGWSAAAGFKLDSPVNLQQTVEGVSMAQGSLRILVKDANLSSSSLFDNERRPPQSFLRSLIQIAAAAQHQEPILLVGPTSFKSLLIRTWAAITGKNETLKKVHLSADSEVSELIGQIQPTTAVKLLEELPILARLFASRVIGACQYEDPNQRSKRDSLNAQISGLQRSVDAAVADYEERYRSQLSASLSSDSNLSSDSLLEDEHQGFQPVNTSAYEPQTHGRATSNQPSAQPLVESWQLLQAQSVISMSNSPSSSSLDEVGSQASGRALDNEVHAAHNLDPFEEDPFASNDSTPQVDGFDPFQEIGDEPTEAAQWQSEGLPNDDPFGEEAIFDTTETIQEVETWSPASISRGQQGFDLSADVRNSAEGVFQLTRMLTKTLGASDSGLMQISKTMNTIWTALLRQYDGSQPQFMFKDGPVVEAATLGYQLLLEDLDAPSQAVTERLNSILETERSFRVTENLLMADQPEIGIHTDFQVFATVHQHHPQQPLKLSPAIRSRFTEVTISGYTANEIREVVTQELQQRLPATPDATHLVDKLFAVRAMTTAQGSNASDIHRLMRWIDFICNHSSEVSLSRRLLLGARFCYLLPGETIGDQLQASWTGILGASADLMWAQRLFTKPAEDDKTGPGAPVHLTPDGNVQLAYTGVVAVLQKQAIQPLTNEMLRDRLKHANTTTFLENTACIFAALQARTPLLLEGPPGIGKTAAVLQVAALLGAECERINFSSSTTFEQLFGMYVPQYLNGKRVFAWQPGKLSQAITAGKWLLLDELNLASAEVLDRIASHLDALLPDQRSCSAPDTPKIHIFATMNPASIGGGRTLLPRAIRNMFMNVQLQEFGENEIFEIMRSLFASSIWKQHLSENHLVKIFKVHNEVKARAKSRQLGQIGGPYDFNLRDIAKVKDAVEGCIQDQMHFYQYSADGGAVESQAAAVRFQDIQDLALSRLLELVYAARFHDITDQLQVKACIKQFFPEAAKATQTARVVTIDESVPDCLQIGHVYMGKGNYSSPVKPLIHTASTCGYLELLATAAQSGRAILLEGDTCSGKTSLVIELARLKQQKLTVISLHQEVDIAQLLGQWLPAQDQQGQHSWLPGFHDYITVVIKELIVYVAPLLPNHDQTDVIRSVLFAVEVRRRSDSAAQDVSTDAALESLELLDHLEEGLKRASQSEHLLPGLAARVGKLFRRLTFYREQLQDISSMRAGKGMAFKFVEGPVIEAAQQGHWILLDNINSAPPEIIERLNSLMEETPSLNLYEHGTGHELKRSDGTIHEDFRIFATANMHRVHSHKLSAALLNRVIRIWLPALDSLVQPLPGAGPARQATLSAQTTAGPSDAGSLPAEEQCQAKILPIVAEYFAGFRGQQELSRLAVQIHLHMQGLMLSGQLLVLHSSKLTLRKLIQSVRGAIALVNRGQNLVPAMERLIADGQDVALYIEDKNSVNRALSLKTLSMLLTDAAAQQHAEEMRRQASSTQSSASDLQAAPVHLVQIETIDAQRVELTKELEEAKLACTQTCDYLQKEHERSLDELQCSIMQAESMPAVVNVKQAAEVHATLANGQEAAGFAQGSAALTQQPQLQNILSVRKMLLGQFPTAVVAPIEECTLSLVALREIAASKSMLQFQTSAARRADITALQRRLSPSQIQEGMQCIEQSLDKLVPSSCIQKAAMLVSLKNACKPTRARNSLQQRLQSGSSRAADVFLHMISSVASIHMLWLEQAMAIDTAKVQQLAEIFPEIVSWQDELCLHIVNSVQIQDGNLTHTMAAADIFPSGYFVRGQQCLDRFMQQLDLPSELRQRHNSVLVQFEGFSFESSAAAAAAAVPSTQQLAQLCNMLSDSPAVRFEADELCHNGEQAQAVLAQLLEEQSIFRARALLCVSQATASSTASQNCVYLACENLSCLATACQPVMQYLRADNLTLLSTYPGLQRLMQWQQVLSTHLQSLPEGLDCSIHPLQLQLSDIIALMAPEDVQSAAFLSCCQSEVATALSGSVVCMHDARAIEQKVAKLPRHRTPVAGSLCAFPKYEVGSDDETPLMHPNLYETLVKSAHTLGLEWCKANREELTRKNANLQAEIERAQKTLWQEENRAKRTMKDALQEAICGLQACQVLTVCSSQPVQQFERAAAPALAFRLFREGAQPALPARGMAKAAIAQAEQCLQQLQEAVQPFTTPIIDVILRMASMFHLGLRSYYTCLMQLPTFIDFCTSVGCSSLRESQAEILNASNGVAAAISTLERCLNIKDKRCNSVGPEDFAQISDLVNQIHNLQVALQPCGPFVTQVLVGVEAFLASMHAAALKYAAILGQPALGIKYTQHSITAQAQALLNHAPPDDEAALRGFIRGLKFQIPTLQATLTRLAPSACYQTAANPFIFLDEIDAQMEQHGQAQISAGFFSKHLLRVMTSLTNRFLSEDCEEVQTSMDQLHALQSLMSAFKDLAARHWSSMPEDATAKTASLGELMAVFKGKFEPIYLEQRSSLGPHVHVLKQLISYLALSVFRTCTLSLPRAIPATASNAATAQWALPHQPSSIKDLPASLQLADTADCTALLDRLQCNPSSADPGRLREALEFLLKPFSVRANFIICSIPDITDTVCNDLSGCLWACLVAFVMEGLMELHQAANKLLLQPLQEVHSAPAVLLDMLLQADTWLLGTVSDNAHKECARFLADIHACSAHSLGRQMAQACSASREAEAKLVQQRHDVREQGHLSDFNRLQGNADEQEAQFQRRLQCYEDQLRDSTTTVRDIQHCAAEVFQICSELELQPDAGNQGGPSNPRLARAIATQAWRSAFPPCPQRVDMHPGRWGLQPGRVLFRLYDIKLIVPAHSIDVHLFCVGGILWTAKEPRPKFGYRWHSERAWFGGHQEAPQDAKPSLLYVLQTGDSCQLQIMVRRLPRTKWDEPDKYPFSTMQIKELNSLSAWFNVPQAGQAGLTWKVAQMEGLKRIEAADASEGYREFQTNVNRLRGYSSQMLFQQASERQQQLKRLVSHCRAHPELPQKVHMTDPSILLKEKHVANREAKIADEKAVRLTNESKVMADLQLAVINLENSCNNLTRATNAVVLFSHQLDLVQQLRFAVVRARAALEHHHRTPIRLSIMQPAGLAAPLSRVWTREMKSAFQDVQVLSRDWQLGLDHLLCTLHQLLSWRVLEHMTNQATHKETQELWQQAEAVMQDIRTSISHSNANAYLIASNQSQLDAARVLLAQRQQQTKQMECGKDAYSDAPQLSCTGDHHQQAVVALRSCRAPATYLTIDQRSAGLCCSSSSVRIDFGTVASGTGQMEHALIINNSLSRPLQAQVSNGSPSTLSNISFEPKKLQVPAHGSSKLQCLLDTSKAVALEEEVDWGNLAADPSSKHTRHLTLTNLSSIRVLIKCRVQPGESAGLFHLKSNRLLLEPHGQAKVAIKLAPQHARGLVTAHLCVGLGSKNHYKMVKLQARLVIPTFQLLCNGKEQAFGASISLPSMQPAEQISIGMQIENSGEVAFEYQVQLSGSSSSVQCSPCSGSIPVGACALIALTISAPAALPMALESAAVRHHVSLHVAGAAQPSFPLVLTGVCGRPKLLDSPRPTHFELRTADAAKLCKQDQEGVCGSLEIRNVGSAGVNIHTTSSAFCLEPQELRISEQQEGKAQLRWWPGRFGIHQRTTEVQLSSSDNCNPTIQWSSKVSARGPLLRLSPPILQFAGTSPASSASEERLTFTVSNQGTKQLKGQLSLVNSTFQPPTDSLILIRPTQLANDPEQVLPMLGHHVCLDQGDTITFTLAIKRRGPATFQHAQLQFKASNQHELGPGGRARKVVSSIQVIADQSADNRLPKLTTVFEQPKLKWLECCWTAVSSTMLNYALFDMDQPTVGLVLAQACFAILGGNNETSSNAESLRSQLNLLDAQQALSASTLQSFFSHALNQSCGMTISGPSALAQLAEIIAGQQDILQQQPGAIVLCMARVLGCSAQKFISTVLPLLNQSSAMPAAAAMLAQMYGLNRQQAAAMQDFTSTLAETPTDVSCAVAFANIFGGTRFMTFSQVFVDLASDLSADIDNYSPGKIATKMLLALSSKPEHHAAGSLLASAMTDMTDASWERSKCSLVELYQRHLASSMRVSLHQQWQAIISTAIQLSEGTIELADLKHILELTEYLAFCESPSSSDSLCQVLDAVLELHSGPRARIGQQCKQVMAGCRNEESAIQTACAMTEALVEVTQAMDAAPVTQQLRLINQVLLRHGPAIAAQADVGQIAVETAELLHVYAAEHQQEVVACLKQASEAAANHQSVQRLVLPLVHLCRLQLADTAGQKLLKAALCLVPFWQDGEAGNLSSGQAVQVALELAAACTDLPSLHQGPDAFATKIAKAQAMADSLIEMRSGSTFPDGLLLMLQSAAEAAQMCGCSIAQEAFDDLGRASADPSGGQTTLILQLCQSMHGSDLQRLKDAVLALRDALTSFPTTLAAQSLQNLAVLHGWPLDVRETLEAMSAVLHHLSNSADQLSLAAADACLSEKLQRQHDHACRVLTCFLQAWDPTSPTSAVPKATVSILKTLSAMQYASNAHTALPSLSLRQQAQRETALKIVKLQLLVGLMQVVMSPEGLLETSFVRVNEAVGATASIHQEDMSISDLARNGGRDGQQAAPINVSQALESGSSNLALMPHQPASSLKAETLAQPVLTTGLRILQLMKVSRIFLGISSPSVRKYMLADEAKVRECFAGIPSGLLPSPVQQALERLDVMSGPQDNYELPAIERLQGSDAQLQPVGSHFSQNAAPEQKWELENFVTQGTQLVSLEVEQLTNPAGQHGADEHGAISEERWMMPLDSILSPISIRLSPSADNVALPGSQQHPAGHSATVQPHGQQASSGAAADRRINAADLVPELITKYVNKKALEAKKPSQKSGQAAIDTAAAAVDEEHLQRLQATINFDPKASITDLVAAYAQAAASKKASSVVVDTSLPCTEHKDLKGSPSDYQRLAQTELLQNSCRLVLRNFQAFFQQFHDKVQQHQDVEWIIMVDNSGSMKSKRIQVAEAIVIIAETLRRIECRFGVWRFGGKGQAGCRMMKALDQPFDHLVGQQILEGFSYTEGTYPASNLERIAKAVWPEDIPASSSTKQTHRAILMVLDGLTQETVTEDYRGILQQKDINLCVLNIKDSHQDKLMDKIKGLFSTITSNNFKVLDTLDIDRMPLLVSELMIRAFDQILQKAANKHQHDPIPQAWQAAASRLTGQIDDYVEVLGDIVFPINCHTRRCGDLSGASLYLPGLIKALCTDFAHKKIFSAKKAGGRREYSVALVMDVSTSMQGHLADAAIETLVCLISALVQIGIENFAIVSFGQQVRLLKACSMPWDAAAIHLLLSQLKFDNECATFDANAVILTTRLLENFGAKGPRTMFVMSDGYGISGSRLAQALQLAQEENVMVMGMGIGLDKTYVPSCYQHWLTAGLPSAVPAAFRQLHGQETSSIASPEDSHGSVPDWEQQLLRDQSSKILTSKDIVENMQHIFSHLHAEAQQSNELKVAPGSMPTSIQLHIVFALDCTGSMQPWITAARQQICGITGAIKPKVQKAVPEVQLDLKFALVAFRDYEDVLPGSPSHIHSFGLTDQPDQLQEWLKSDVCSPSGGGDLPEDVLGGLNEAIDLVKGSGDEAIIKFVVLIGDGPAHGPECNSGLPDRFPNGCPGQPSFTVKQVMERMQHEHVDLLMTRIRPEATDVMLAAFRSYYDVKDCRVKVSTADLYDYNQPPRSSCHMVFCLDASGSMRGRKWDQLQQAYHQCLLSRITAQAVGDKVSVITFDDTPRVIIRCEDVTAASAHRLPYTGGGTAFVPALNQAHSLLEGAPAEMHTSHTPVILFLSDGHGEGAGPACDAMQKVSAAWHQHGLQVTTVAFGSRADHACLEAMAQTAGGKFKAASTGEDLMRIFEAAAQDCNAVDGLVKRFEETISDMISTKVVLDHM
ncbi:hypothetical protein WJX74_002690 [Apatococcus lobatus]|uniref:Midasin n=1 Tax=Apatococcus lobatus TaxID=904363 RepID=A0AAW1QH18_9CHLO